MGLFNLIVICIIFLVSPSITFSQPVGEEYEPTPEELDAAFSASDYEAMKAGYSKKIYSNRIEIKADNLLAQADVVIEGVVTNIHYRYGKNDFPTAHTEITVTRVLKGTFDDPVLVITQPGGPSREGKQGYMVSNVHFFDVGEGELLFLDFPWENNTRIINRFRIYQGKMYNVDGYGLLMDANGVLRLSRDRNPAERFETINMGTHRLWKKFSEPEINADASNPDAANTLSPVVSASYSESISVDEFIAILP